MSKQQNKSIADVMEEFYDEFVEKGDSPTADGHDMTPDKWNGRYKDEENLIYRIESFFKGNLTSLVQQSKGEETKKVNNVIDELVKDCEKEFEDSTFHEQQRYWSGRRAQLRTLKKLLNISPLKQ